ncbi:ABC transporter permease [Thalassovita taeanensis]|uniref:Peptide/nickel transport system permease protein n=1 Tax=Thalassovita taeanensis TaxID=657014 RepID=A0A1H9JWQ7_9RHOB|nr:ABC transporter permease [Thalassovita taeanensis]SEQ91194.1 peptide/nickel transport system permease protein [Thalassovita taeanensis]
MITRLLRAGLTLLLLATFTFFALSISADPALQILGPDAPPDVIAAFRARWQLDQPLLQRYGTYLLGILQLDFGLSYRTGQPAIDLVAQRLPATLALMIPTGLASLLIGVPLGIFSAVKLGTTTDRLIMTASVIGFAVPNFLVGILLMYVFSVWLGWLDPSGITSGLSWIMPMITMVSAEAGVFARFTRSAMAEVLAHPMHDTALSGGLSARLTLRRHSIPNAMIPLLTLVGLFVGSLVGGAVITENVFSWPGIGRLLVESVAARDFAVVQIIVLLIGTTMVVTNLLVDMSYGLIDPRIRDARRGGVPA